MKRYIKSSEYYDEYSETTIKTDGEIYGYEFLSEMPYITAMFCHEDREYLRKHIKKIYELLTMEDADGEYLDYCDEVGITIVDNERGYLYKVKGYDTWIAEIGNNLYDVIVIAKDSARI